ncbi:MAG: nicotinate (nicotinamide) nucleotide adenylyltransferase [Myxococcota bacterium]
MTRARVAMYGGSFDPPHLGHVLSVSWVLASADIDEVWVIPTWKHPFEKAHGASFEARVAMCELAFAQFEHAEVSTIEQTLGGTSHTLTTIESLQHSNPDTEFRLLVGADVLPEAPKWHRWDDIVKAAPPIVIGREGYPQPEGCPITIPNVSSTDARGSLRQNDPIEGWVPRSVVDYIRAHALYQDAT